MYVYVLWTDNNNTLTFASRSATTPHDIHIKNSCTNQLYSILRSEISRPAAGVPIHEKLE